MFAVMGAAPLTSMECSLHCDGLMTAGLMGDRVLPARPPQGILL